jgi:hypothetical protein
MSYAGLLRQSTAVTVTIGPTVSNEDGYTAITTGVTRALTRLSKNDGTFAQKNQTSNPTHKTEGYWSASLDTTDTNTLGILVLEVSLSTALKVRHTYLVVPAAVYDAVISGTGNGVRADVQAIAANVIGASQIAANAIGSSQLATDAIGASQIAADAIQAAKIQNGALTAAKFAAGAFDAVWAVAARTLTAFGFSVTVGTNNDKTGYGLADNAISAAKVATDAIDADALASDLDTYQAKVWLFDDNAGDADRYAVVFFKNGQPVVSGITSPTIQVIAVADGTDLIEATALAEVGSLGLYRYTATTTERISDGAAYIAKVSATIDGGGRTWFQPVGRDS